jgi:hypothetical protein
MALENAINSCNFGEIPTIQALAEYMGVSEKTVRNRIKEHGGYEINDSNIRKKET